MLVGCSKRAPRCNPVYLLVIGQIVLFVSDVTPEQIDRNQKQNYTRGRYEQLRKESHQTVAPDSDSHRFLNIILALAL